jgi:hypothetical protein
MFMRNTIILLLIIIPWQLLFAQSEYIVSEKGFDGAVNVENLKSLNGIDFVTVTIPYLGMNGDTLKGQARFYYKQELLDSNNKISVYCGVHYEASENTINRYIDMGMAVVSPYFGEIPINFPFGNSINFSKAMIQWARRLPFVDRSKFILGGSSGGGYMTLAMGAEFFPLGALVSNLPCPNWIYGTNYLLKNQESSGCYLPKDKPRPLPVLALLAPGADLAMTIFEKDLKSKTWYILSPISYVDRITAPTMVTSATGDMLCTIDMITSKKFFTLNKDEFPDSYVRDLKKLTFGAEGQVTLEESIPESKLATHIIDVQEGQYQFSENDPKILDDKSYNITLPKEIDRPWSKDKQWNLVILNEGAPLPYIGHNRYLWNTSNKTFVNYYKNRETDVEQLNEAKLKRLLERYSGRLSEVALLANGNPANRLNFDRLEKLDVVTGLLDYANLSPVHEKNLIKLYNASSIKPFGEILTIDYLKMLSNSLQINKGH